MDRKGETMSKLIQVSQAPDKPEFNYTCLICKKHRRVHWYEPANEVESRKRIPADSKRMFIGPMCSDCLEDSDEYEVKGEDDGEETGRQED